jgi:hypothetical protein
MPTRPHTRPGWCARKPAEREPEVFDAVFAPLVLRAQERDPDGRLAAE